MKKPLFPRIIYVLLLYLAVFSALVTVQFARQRGFTQRIGSMTISGHYGEDAEEAASPAGTSGFLHAEETPETYPPEDAGHTLSGELTLTYGGMDFRISNFREGYRFIHADGRESETLPSRMILTDSSAAFRYADGTELSFALYGKDASGPRRPELRIAASLGEGINALELPFRPRRSSRIRDDGTGQFVIIAGGVNYSFNASRMNEERRAVIFERDGAAVSYKAVPEERAFSMDDYVLELARDRGAYQEALNRWGEAGYHYWSASAIVAGDEELVKAYLAEGVNRGTYRQAQASLPRAFVQSGQQTYQSSVYLGRMDQGLRSFLEAEQRALARETSLEEERSLDFLDEPHALAGRYIRGRDRVASMWLESLATMEPLEITAERLPGILEAHEDWLRFVPEAAESAAGAVVPGEEPPLNPFEGVLPEALGIIREGLHRDENDRVFFFADSRADVLLNLRLGLALDKYGVTMGDDEWGALGRSLTLSALSLVEPMGAALSAASPGSGQNAGLDSFPRTLLLEDGFFREDMGAPSISAARLYRYLDMPYYPRAERILNYRGSPLWTWTAAGEIRATELPGNSLDIEVQFPPGETHYMIIRGVRPFAKLQLYNMDYRTDPQFERYDSSGWTYSSQEQTLIIKMKHRDPIEHIKIFF